ncbi:MAG TPA: hypothetical protein VMU31_09480, partial [Rhizomicrobium sp.]|nr:hypothetical protein [Rhizomicrobium sp.]
ANANEVACPWFPQEFGLFPEESALYKCWRVTDFATKVGFTATQLWFQDEGLAGQRALDGNRV